MLLQLAPDKVQFEVGELLALRLSIENNSELPIKVDNAIWCNYQLAFVEPSVINLIGPSGHNLLQSYHVNALPDHDCATIMVESGSRFYSTIPLSDWVYMREPGEYHVWLELVDSLEERFRSNALTFEINASSGRVPQERIGLALDSEQMTYTIEELLNAQVGLELTFTNMHTETISILRPQGGSFINAVNPIYRIVVRDNMGRELRMIRATDANIGEPVYDETTTLSLPPGDSETLRIRMPHFPEMRQPGQYEVSLVYIVREHAVSLGIVTNELMPWAPDIFVGVLESNSVDLKVIEGWKRH